MVWKNNDITRQEATWGSLTLIAFVIITFCCWSINYPSISNLDSESDVTTLHDEISKYKYRLLAVAGVLLIILPLPLAHAYFMKRMFDTVLSYAFFQFYQWAYIICMIMGAIVVSVLIPAVLIIVAYYNWEITDDTDGYYIQAFLMRLSSLLGYSATFIFGLNSILPFIILISTIFGICEAKLGTQGLYIATDDSRNEFINRILCIKYRTLRILCGTLSILFVILILFAVFASVFSWDQHGFFSLYENESSSHNDYDSESYKMIVIVFFAYLLFGIWLLYVSFNLENIQGFVEDMHDFADNLYINTAMHTLSIDEGIHGGGAAGAQSANDEYSIRYEQSTTNDDLYGGGN